MTEATIAYNNGCYRIAIPWKEEIFNLPKSYHMAEKRLYNLERRLFREPVIAEEYKGIIDKHLEKGYVTKVPLLENQLTVRWYLPHFPIVKKDRSTTSI